jgi:hypothetical protein
MVFVVAFRSQLEDQGDYKTEYVHLRGIDKAPRRSPSWFLLDNIQHFASQRGFEAMLSVLRSSQAEPITMMLQYTLLAPLFFARTYVLPAYLNQILSQLLPLVRSSSMLIKFRISTLACDKSTVLMVLDIHMFIFILTSLLLRDCSSFTICWPFRMKT